MPAKAEGTKGDAPADGVTKENAMLSPMFVDPNLPDGWTRQLVQRAGGETAGKWDVYVQGCGKKFRSRPELERFLTQQNISDIKSQDIDFNVYGTHNQSALKQKSQLKPQAKLKPANTKKSKSKAVEKKLPKKDIERGLVYVKFSFKAGTKRKRSTSEVSVDLEELEAHPYLPPTPGKHLPSPARPAKPPTELSKKKEKADKTATKKTDKTATKKTDKTATKKTDETVSMKTNKKAIKQNSPKVKKSGDGKMAAKKKCEKENKKVKTEVNLLVKRKNVPVDQTELSETNNMKTPLKEIQNQTLARDGTDGITPLLKSSAVKQISAELEHSHSELILSPVKCTTPEAVVRTPAPKSKTPKTGVRKTPTAPKSKSKGTGSAEKNKTKKIDKNQKSVMDYFKKIV